jgi:hypothetical protein
MPDATPSKAESLTENPLALVAGGIAIGMVIGALLPRLDREKELLAPVGKTIADNVTATVKAARAAGQAEIQGLLPDREATKERVTQLIGSVLDAAKGATAKAD